MLVLAEVLLLVSSASCLCVCNSTFNESHFYGLTLFCFFSSRLISWYINHLLAERNTPSYTPHTFTDINIPPSHRKCYIRLQLGFLVVSFAYYLASLGFKYIKCIGKHSLRKEAK